MRLTRGAVAVLVGLLLAILPAAGAAQAHDRTLRLEVAGDGATGVTVQATYTDGHRLESVVRLVLTATAEGGRTVGPTQLEPVGEGQGFYFSGPVLTPGTWQVTVSAPAPYTGATTAEVRAVEGQAPPPAELAERAEAANGSSSGAGWWRWALPIGLAVLALAVLAVAVSPTRRRTGGKV
ncbi:hypothetical protein O7632_28895 [Solwaraspora sp. WMMD406]|uniref:hypothetical protein n=1 Tax=Solwaraspora sp. WMMD406 TaxID=3016095 RepID=UPI00241728A9|nr:hypothetical protein [Solwaraspora sp. WMMD406]MDG4768078.1 hypothetical protein [Solwaraspora sp. WMMD406]